MAKDETQKFMGANQMLPRLAAQVGSHEKAVEILIGRGHLLPDGKTWTPEGARRNAMTAEERAIDRAVQRTGKSPSSFKYDPRTNKANLRKKWGA